MKSGIVLSRFEPGRGLGLHVHGVDLVLHIVEADRYAAKATSPAVGSLRRQLEASRPHGLLPRMEGTVTAIRIEVDLGAPGQKVTPRSLEGTTRLVKSSWPCRGRTRKDDCNRCPFTSTKPAASRDSGAR